MHLVHKPESQTQRPLGPGSGRNGASRQDRVVGSGADCGIQRGYAPWSSCTTGRNVSQGHGIEAYPVPEGQEAPEASVLPEVSESHHKTSKNVPQSYVAVGKNKL